MRFGGLAYKFGLFQKKEDGQWMTGSAQSKKILTEQEALETGKKIHGYLVEGVWFLFHIEGKYRYVWTYRE